MGIWASLAGGAAATVSSVFGRIGAVVAAAFDYAASQVSAVAHGTTAATNVQGQLDEITDEKVDKTTTITLPAAGVGLFHYITSISWYRHSTAALVGTGAFNITSTNLPGSLKWRIGNAIAVGENRIDVDFVPLTPLKSSVANTNTTIVAAAAGAAVLTTGLCTYYVGG